MCFFWDGVAPITRTRDPWPERGEGKSPWPPVTIRSEGSTPWPIWAMERLSAWQILALQKNKIWINLLYIYIWREIYIDHGRSWPCVFFHVLQVVGILQVCLIGSFRVVRRLFFATIQSYEVNVLTCWTKVHQTEPRQTLDSFPQIKHGKANSTKVLSSKHRIQYPQQDNILIGKHKMDIIFA